MVKVMRKKKITLIKPLGDEIKFEIRRNHKDRKPQNLVTLIGEKDAKFFGEKLKVDKVDGKP